MTSGEKNSVTIHYCSMNSPKIHFSDLIDKMLGKNDFYCNFWMTTGVNAYFETGVCVVDGFKVKYFGLRTFFIGIFVVFFS